MSRGHRLRPAPRAEDPRRNKFFHSNFIRTSSCAICLLLTTYILASNDLVWEYSFRKYFLLLFVRRMNVQWLVRRRYVFYTDNKFTRAVLRFPQPRFAITCLLWKCIVVSCMNVIYKTRVTSNTQTKACISKNLLYTTNSRRVYVSWYYDIHRFASNLWQNSRSYKLYQCSFVLSLSEFSNRSEVYNVLLKNNFLILS